MTIAFNTLQIFRRVLVQLWYNFHKSQNEIISLAGPKVWAALSVLDNFRYLEFDIILVYKQSHTHFVVCQMTIDSEWYVFKYHIVIKIGILSRLANQLKAEFAILYKKMIGFVILSMRIIRFTLLYMFSVSVVINYF